MLLLENIISVFLQKIFSLQCKLGQNLHLKYSSKQMALEFRWRSTKAGSFFCMWTVCFLKWKLSLANFISRSCLANDILSVRLFHVSNWTFSRGVLYKESWICTWWLYTQQKRKRGKHLASPVGDGYRRRHIHKQTALFLYCSVKLVGPVIF